MPIYQLSNLLAQAQSQNGTRELINNLARTPLSQVVYFVAALTIIRLAIAPKLKNTPPHLRFGTYGAFRFLNEVIDAIVYAGVFVFMVIRPFGVQAFLIPSGSMWPTLYVDDFIVANKAVYRYSDPKAGDVVVFRPPVEATLGRAEQIDKDGTVNVDFIKRCVGTPGDIVELRDGVLYRNGKQMTDPSHHYSHSDNQHDFTEIPASDVAKASFKLIKWKDRVIPLNYNGTEANIGMGGNGYDVHPNFALAPDEMAAAIAAPALPVPAGKYLMFGDNRNNSFDSRGWGLVDRANIIGRSEFIWMPLPRIGRTAPVQFEK